MSRTVSLIRKLIALIIGVPVIIVGIILIPLPGPGLLITFAGLFIISLEFDWAKKYVDAIKLRFRKMYTDAQKRADRVAGTSKDDTIK